MTEQRHGFFDVRRILRLLREQAGEAAWFTLRHAEVALLLWDMKSQDGLEVQGLPSLLGLDASTVNRILHTLGNKHRTKQGLGWIEVREDVHDRRYRRVFFTDLGEHVFQTLLFAGTSKDKGADLAKSTESHILIANNIATMKAEVGQVTVKTNNNTARATVLRGLSHDETMKMETLGKIQRVMERDDGRWTIYDKDADVYSDEPIYVQNDMPKEDLNNVADGYLEIILTLNAEGFPEKENLEDQLEWAVRKMNRDEYQRLRSRLMRGLARAAEEKQSQAERKIGLAEREKEKATGLMNRVGHQPNVNLHEKNQMYAEAKDSMNNWAEMSQSAGEDMQQSDMMKQMMATVMKLTEKVEQLQDVVNKREEDSDG